MIEKQNNAYYELLAKQLIDENETYLFDYNLLTMPGESNTNIQLTKFNIHN